RTSPGRSLAAPASTAPGPAARTRAPVTARPTGAALRLRPSLIDDEIPIPEEAPIQHLDRLGRLLFGAHLDKSQPPRPTRDRAGPCWRAGGAAAPALSRGAWPGPKCRRGARTALADAPPRPRRGAGRAVFRPRRLAGPAAAATGPSPSRPATPR